ncbi:glycosyl transferase, group 1 family protein [Lunatimonas lonarensis]|uniref:Glycosyl transferase, group 1 family protein n=2 Tax=Lunatimonas lonarensis TaxID=1232681 RepID=R7ZP28_9BACT|nr:glycosyl transferase, group 1 family protein [Lunatimonas lonarensis]
MNGIFIQEQALALAKRFPHIQIGVSLWGQQKEDYLLWGKDLARNILKLIKGRKKTGKTNLARQPLPNFYEWETSAFTWTDKYKQGNLRGIQKANEQNLLAFEQIVGKVDLIHAHVCHKAGIIASWLSKKKGIPYLITEQMSPFPFTQILTRQGTLTKKYRDAYEQATINIAISPDLKRRMQKMGIPNIRVIPNLADEQFFIPAKKSPANPFTFFTLCDMRVQKDLPTLLKAIKRLLSADHSARFLIGGDGEMFDEWSSLSNKMGLSQHVDWLGPLDREQARHYYQQAHAFVLPSQHETLGVVFLEAIACGLPVIATRCGGPECIVNKDNGLLVETGNPKELALAMEKLMENYPSYDKMTIRNFHLEYFASFPICNQLMKTYYEVCTQ